MENIVLYEQDDRVASITLNRPEKKNALSPTLIENLLQAIKQAGEDEAVKIVILKASGDVFSAGADLEYMAALSTNSFEENLKDSERLKDLFLSIYQLPKVVIGQVEGHAIAGGCGLISVCDFVFSVPEAKFGYTETRIGFAPAIVSCFLAAKLKEGVMRDILLTGRLFPASEAKEFGLINFVFEANELAQRVKDFANNLCVSNSGNSLAVTKQLIADSAFPLLESMLEKAVRINAGVRESEDFKKGLNSFVNKEKFDW